MYFTVPLCFLPSLLLLIFLPKLGLSQRRLVRSPDSERIQRWKLAFSGDLAPLPRVLPTVSCNWALNELCLKHVSCRELWALFRRNCLVDAQNNCLMTNKNDCWQSFEGISWTGLGTCACPGNNSDCHWILLQTNYNKCIYELSNDRTWRPQLSTAEQFFASRRNGNGGGRHSMNWTATKSAHDNAGGRAKSIGVENWREEKRENEEEDRERQSWSWRQTQRKQMEMEEQERRRKEEEEKQRNEERRRKQKEEDEERRRREDEEKQRNEERKRKKEEERKQLKEKEEEEKRTNEEKRRRELEKKAEEEDLRKKRKEKEEIRIKAKEEEEKRKMEKEAEERKRRIEEENERRKHYKMRAEEEKNRKKQQMEQGQQEYGQRQEDRGANEQQRSSRTRASSATGRRITAESAGGGNKSIYYTTTGGTGGKSQNKSKSGGEEQWGAQNGWSKESRRKQAENGLERGEEKEEEENGKNIISVASSRRTTDQPKMASALPTGTTPPNSSASNGWSTESQVPQRWNSSEKNGITTTSGGRSRETTTATIGDDAAVELTGYRTQPSKPPITTPLVGIWTAADGNQQKISDLSASDAANDIPANMPTQEEAPPTSAPTRTPTIMERQSKSCARAMELCNRDETCKWHLSELYIKCQRHNPSVSAEYCQRSSQCSAALNRFVLFVPSALAQAMMFCRQRESAQLDCNNGLAAGNCMEIAQTFFPPILLSGSQNCSSSSLSTVIKQRQRPRWTCVQTGKMCQAEPVCSRRLSALRAACPLSSPDNSTSAVCSPNVSLAKCRSALVSSRGTWLDEPCHCPPDGDRQSRDNCARWRLTLWPGNPCIDAVLDGFAFDEQQMPVSNRVQFGGGNLSSSTNARTEATIPLVRKKEKPLKMAQAATINTSANRSEWMMLQLGDEVTLLPAEFEGGGGGEVGEQKKANGVGGSDKRRPKTTRRKGMAAKARTTMANATEEGDQENKQKKGKQMDGKRTKPTDANVQLDQPQQNGRLAYELLAPAEEGGGNQSEQQTGPAEPLPTIGTAQRVGSSSTTGRQLLPTDGEFVTQQPPSEGGGCRTRNVDGDWVEHYPGAVFREYHDWAGRCSSWCQCPEDGNGTADCHRLDCLADVLCEARHTTVAFGQRLYLENRGACLCHDGRFVCDSSELQPELEAGLYITMGYSKAELDLLREQVPKPVLERSGLISRSSSFVKDLATRLQFALERVLPEDTKCRVAVLEHFPPEQVLLMQLQWFGVDPRANQSKPKWHSGRMEKLCSPFVRELELTFLLEKADRYQLILSTIKQLRVVDLLDGLTPRSTADRAHIVPAFRLLAIFPWIHISLSVSLLCPQLVLKCAFAHFTRSFSH